MRRIKNFVVSRWEGLLIVGSVIALLLFTAVGNLLFDEGYWTNVFTEVLGAFLTAAVVSLFTNQLSKRRQTQQQKAELIVQMSSRSNDFALMAVKLLRINEWLQDGTLKGANLIGANLEDADLGEANLYRAYLRFTNLKGADLARANLEGADLKEANIEGTVLSRANLQSACLRGAHLRRTNLRLANLQSADLGETNLQSTDFEFANLKNANLREANLKGADLARANLEGADLARANLQGASLIRANLQGAKGVEKAFFDENTILPDKTKWREGVDLSPFVDTTKQPDKDNEDGT